ncbi:MAG: SurA N-terminal domain-containing protein, partial [Bacteroidia bacterium]|nr:SurA N-terminal domain-containing protein [Bacteroidia bacterium]
MAVLQKIRNRAGILISLIIGIALFAFVLSDMLSPRKSAVCKRHELIVGNIDGEPVPYQYYQEKIDQAIENYKNRSKQKEIDERTSDGLVEQAWEYIVNEILMGKEYEELGIDVTDLELLDMVRGRNIDPMVMQVPIFQDENGAFDKNRVIKYISGLENDPEQEKIWASFEDDLIRNRKYIKYHELLKKGYYIPSFIAKQNYLEKNYKTAITFVTKRYGSIPDSLIAFNDDDLNDYYDKNIENYKREASRDIEYVVFEIIPSEKDIQTIEKELSSLKEEFARTEEDAQFVNMNSEEPFDNNYFKREELPKLLDSLLFDSTKGTMLGPYREGEAFKISKLCEARDLPDTVRARHILFKAKTQDEYIKSKALADSIKTLIENGANFAELAFKFGTDATRDKGGDLGWFKKQDMVQPFGDTCILSPVGHLSVVFTEFGVHL